MNIALMTTCKPRLDNYKKEVMESILSIAPQVDTDQRCNVAAMTPSYHCTYEHP